MYHVLTILIHSLEKHWDILLNERMSQSITSNNEFDTSLARSAELCRQLADELKNLKRYY